MNYYWLYLKEGLTHITDINGYDHILFIFSISCIYTLKHFRKLIYIVSSFTVAHCISLVLATTNIVQIQPTKIEFVIPLTIIFACLYNLYRTRKKDIKMFHVEQTKNELLLVFAFGLIHGLGFSNYLRFILSSTESLLGPMLCFNIGLEVGQLLILVVGLGLNQFILSYSRFYRHWVQIQLWVVLILSLNLTLQNIIN